MSDNPNLTAVGDEPVEARIVAWVLGEASVFEAAELERLCEERPELLVFRRRMRALHGLLAAAEAAEPDRSWQLTPEKRRVLDELFDASEPAVTPMPVAKRRHRFPNWGLSLLAACVLLGLVPLALLSQGGGCSKPPMKSMAAARSESAASQRLKLEYPPEMIEGTPKPMVLPAATPLPSAPQSGSSQWSSTGVVTGGALKLSGLSSAADADAAPPMAGAKADLAKAKELTASASSTFDAIPNTELALQAPRKAAAAGVGGGGGGANRESDEALAKNSPEILTRGTRSGDGTVRRANIDALLEGQAAADGRAAANPGKPNQDTGALAFAGMELQGAGAARRPQAAAEPASATTSDHFAANGGSDRGAIVSGIVTELDDRLSGRPQGERMVEDRKKRAEEPQGPAAKVPTLLDSAATASLSDRNVPVPTGGDGQSVVQNELTKQLAEPQGSLGKEAKDASKTQNVDALRRKLYTAEGAYNLGKFDQAKQEYENALRIDPYNAAARRGLETIASAKSSYYRAAYDHTRAEMLMEVDKAWELSVPADAKPAESKATADQPAAPPMPAAFGFSTKDEATKAKSAPPPAAAPSAEAPVSNLKSDVSNLAEDEMIRRSAPVADADRFVTAAREAYAKGDFQTAYNYHEKALGLLPDAPMLKDQRDFLRESLGQNAVALAEQSARNGRADESRNWFSKALEWNPNNEIARKLQVIDPASETAAAAEPYSTFSLSISDASFKTAQAALAKGERPDPAGIRVEQFYNAVDYGDPAPGANEPVAATVEQAAHPVVPGRNLVRVALRTGATGRSATQPLQLTLLVDQSGSMARDDRRSAMTQALTQLAGLLGPDDRVTVVGFSLTARMLADGLKGDQAGKLPQLVNQAASEGGTNLEGALVLAKQLAEARKLPGAQNRIVLFTDGAANLGNANPVQLADTVKAMRQQGLAFDVAGIGTSELNDRLLGELARHGNGRFYVVGSTADANDGFARQLAGAFRPAAENVKVQVRFNPQRVGGYKLIGFEEHRLNQEDFRNDAVDAAELAAEEAGVALYQVEPLPGGNGELGEVSVRFRDAASGQMVERSWTIPYDSNAPAFDRSAPSLQLAGLAMLAAEKLRGGPLAEAIDFSQFVTPRATVKQFYPNNRRVAEVLEMVGALR